MKPLNQRTKIVATIGPASSSPEVLRRLFEAGVNTFRLNFSHGTHESHSEILSRIREISRALDRHVGILQDLCGPKVRLGPIPGDVVECALNEEFTLVVDRTSEDPHELTCSYRELPNDLQPGESVLFADGTVAMMVVDTAPGRARMKVTLPGRLRSKQGVNLPGSALAVNALTEKDLQDLDWTARHAGDVDYIGLSFVRQAGDVVRLREELRKRSCPARIVVKIEKPQAVEHLEAIVAATDGVMVARGDLGVEMDVQRVPSIQKRIIALCNKAHRPVITATQMLNSMEHSSRPTRAEASDVFNAVLDGTDAVMLSGESAIGEYPVEAVATMRRICSEAEDYLEQNGRPRTDVTAASLDLTDSITEAAVNAAVLMNEQLDAALIVVAADSGRAALSLSNRRPSASIVAMTTSVETARSLSLCWGVTALLLPGAWPERVLSQGIEWAKAQGLVRTGQHAVLLRDRVAGQRNARAVLAGEVG
jgi:pyruvate kinase